MYTLLYIIYIFILFSKLNVILHGIILSHIIIYHQSIEFEFTVSGRVPYNFLLYPIIIYYCTPILFLSPILSNKNILTRIGVAWRACDELKYWECQHLIIIPVNFFFSKE